MLLDVLMVSTSPLSGTKERRILIVTKSLEKSSRQAKEGVVKMKIVRRTIKQWISLGLRSIRKKRALISVSNKEGIADFARELVALGYQIYSSGNTAKAIIAAGIKATDVSSLVGGKAMLGHKVVTLSRQIAGGLLADKNVPEDVVEVAKWGLKYFKIVCVDFYPLQKEIAKEGSTPESVRANTDIGGPLMVRAGAKGRRLVICDPSDRQKVLDWIRDGEKDESFVDGLAAKAEFTVAKYCSASANYISNGKYVGIHGIMVALCKYGENAWQKFAALFSCETSDLLALDKFVVVEGTTPSYNNYCDMDRLLQTITHVAAACDKNLTAIPPIAIGAKHGNPCGAAVGDLTKVNEEAEVLSKMLAGDPLAIMGGLIMVNFSIDVKLAELLVGKMLDGIIAPWIAPEAIEMLKRKGDKCRFITNSAL
ncbi:MAG: hypothetical protein WCW14_01490, partial [Candidatus Paceibacterota bacterium]